jgi:hypothetical protein
MLGRYGGSLSSLERAEVLKRIINVANSGEEMAFVLVAGKVPLPVSLPVVESLASEGRNDVVQRAAAAAAESLTTVRDALAPEQLHSAVAEWATALCLDAAGDRKTVCATLDSLFAAGPGDVAALAQLKVLADQALGEGTLTPSEHAVLVGNAERLVEIAPASTMVTPAADTYLRAGNPNQNQGTESVLRVRPDGDNRSLIQFDQAAVAALVGSGTVTAARLELTIVENFDNWGPSGRTVDVHRLTQAWTEFGATWNCGDDLEPVDPNPDCPTTAWAMSGQGTRPWVATPTATVTLTTGLRGVVAFDVTADVQAFLSGAANVGWLVKRTDEGPSGAVDFGARESGTPPRLVLQVQ